MRKILLLAVLGITAAAVVGVSVRGRNAAQMPAAPTAAAPVGPSGFDSSRAWEHLRQMVAIGPRPAGSTQIRQTRAYITHQLTGIGLTVQEQPFVAETPLGRVEMVNLIVRLPGRRPDRILFTGHYDTKLFTDQVFVGASDGASSAAFLIELARVLKDRPREFTYDLVWFDGEEAVREWLGNDHTYGSRYYVQAERRADTLSSIKAMLLVDMIGDRDLQIRKDAASTAWLTDLIWDAARRAGRADVFVDRTTQVEDDHLPFISAGIPAVDIIDLDYPAWHTSDDDLNHVSPASLQAVGDVILTAIPDLEQRLR